MKNELLMVTEIEFSDSDRITRYEIRREYGYTGEEWTRARPDGPWRPKKRSSRTAVWMKVWKSISNFAVSTHSLFGKRDCVE